LLFDLLLSGDRAEIDALMDRFIDEAFGEVPGEVSGGAPNK